MSRAEMEEAVRVLRSGGLVAFPTETVYGLGADAENEAAVRRVYEVKRRPEGHPLIVHLPAPGDLEGWAREVPAETRSLAAAFWPGPLTLILRKGARVAEAVTGGADTVGLRVPGHPLTLELLRSFAGGVAAPSANRFGSVSPTTAQHVREDLGDDVDLVVDGGPCEVGVESTIVDLSGTEPRVLRPGGVTREQLEEVLGRPVAAGGAGEVKAPGTLPVHYAPRARVVLAAGELLAERAAAELAAGARVGVLAPEGTDLPPGVDHIPAPTDPREAARRLYASLREADRRGWEVVIAAVPAEGGLWDAIADRLLRAAAAGGGAEGPGT